MEDKRTRSDYIKEIERLERENRKLERLKEHFIKSHDELIRYIEDELYDIDRRIEFIKEKDNTNGGYTMRMYLTQQKNTLIKVSKKIDELERV